MPASPSWSSRGCGSRSSSSSSCPRSSWSKSTSCLPVSAARADSGRRCIDARTALMEPRIRVSAILRWQERLLLCRQEKPGKEYWLLPGGGVDEGETLIEALRRELREELGVEADVPFEGPVALIDSIAPKTLRPGKHVVHIVFAAD